jgi:hypothetical protein
MCKISASHPAGLECLRELVSKMSVKVSALHNHYGTLSVLFDKPPGKYEMNTCEHLWPDGPVNIYLHGKPLDLENEDTPNPFVNGFANGHTPVVQGKPLVRRI